MTAILGTRTTADRDRAAYNLFSMSVHSRFINEMFEPLWNIATHYGIDPIMMVAQSLKETGKGHFTGKVPPTYFNTSGIKVRDLTVFPDSEVTLAHSQYASWYLGAIAQAQHLYAYMGKPLPEGEFLVDPRWVWVYGKHSITQVEELGGRWAGSGNVNYGIEIVNPLMIKLVS